MAYMMMRIERAYFTRHARACPGHPSDEGFTKTYGLKLLVYVERHDDIRDAIQREKSLKRWLRTSDLRLVHEANPGWHDLYDTLI